MTAIDVAFLVGGEVQLEGARAVARAMSHRSAGFDSWAGQFSPLAEITPRGHVPPVTARRLSKHYTSVRRWARAGRVLVVPQDMGMLQRASVAAARAGGARVVLLPDGVVSGGRVRSRRSIGGLADLSDRLLSSLGVLAGRHGVLGASAPDVVLSWGPGWDATWEANGAHHVRDCGNPRADTLAALPPPPSESRLLVCSQPMWQPAVGGSAAAVEWYRQLSSLAASSPQDRLRIRLHPAERDRAEDLGLGDEARARLTSGPLVDDLAWSSALIGWVSSTLVEGAACGRPVASIRINAAADRVADAYAFTADPRVPRLRPMGPLTWEGITGALAEIGGAQSDLAGDYLTGVGSASRACAAVVDEFVDTPAS